MRPLAPLLAAVLLLGAAACSGSAPGTQGQEREASQVTDADAPGSGEGETEGAERELATLGAGCFWCVEAVLEQVEGIVDVRSGYMGGEVEDPSYREVCTGETGHAEVVQVEFDPAKIGYEEVLDWFWRLHDPTTPNRQGADVGTQYRSVVFTHSDAQREAAERSRATAQASFADPVVTEIVPASTFYEAETYHQDYYRQNREQGYCRVVIRPKLEKLGLEE